MARKKKSVITKDIATAVEREADYLLRKNSGEDVHIYDFIGPCGYTDVNEFYWDKQLYLLQHTNYIVEEEPYIDLNFTNYFFRNKVPAFLWTIKCNTTYAFVPNEQSEFAAIQESGLTPLKIGYSAQNGIIISSDGDLRIFLIYPGDLEIKTEHFLSFFKDYLADKFDSVEIDKNDVLVNGKKVLGSARIPQINGMGVFVIQTSFSDKSALIKKICGESAKIPGYLDPNVVSPYDLKDGFLRWLGM